ncbi:MULTISPECIES: helix-turn-helix domain-containing protein [Listeria]|uniref:GH39 family glycosyl hydrolase n=1 Tax=Listeria TaxID=1637 RepID=UPI000B591107|nr:MULTISPECIES: helix-turn-helix domain-containing protein [Listeria]
MIQAYEMIQTEDKLPFRLLIHRLTATSSHWHDSIEIIFVLKGSISLYTNLKSHQLSENDIFLVNANQIHALHGHESNTLLVLQIPLAEAKKSIPNIDHLTFHCQSSQFSSEEQASFDQIRQIFAEMIQEVCKEGSDSYLNLTSLYYKLLFTLVHQFSAPIENLSNQPKEKHIARLTDVLNYMNTNFQTNLTLEELARHVFLSKDHLSKFIRQQTGQSFKQLLTSIRLNAATKELMTTNHSVKNIAIDTGFPSETAFVKAFKEIYSASPTEHRKNDTSTPAFSFTNNSIEKQYIEIDMNEIYQHLAPFLNQTINPQDSIIHTTLPATQIAMNKPGRTANWCFQKLITVSKAKELFLAPVQEQLKETQQEIGFEYIRFHGIFDDAMHVYDENSAGEPLLNFAYVDMLIDFLLKNQLKPFIEIGFMPEKLRSSEHHHFHKKSYLSYPNDMQKWLFLVKNFFLHIEKRYGKKEVASWYFEIWNEPDIAIFWQDSIEAFNCFYAETYQTIREINPHYKIGTPGIFPFPSQPENPTVKKFADFLKNKKITPDFVSFHCYYTDNLPTNHAQSAQLPAYSSGNLHYLSAMIQMVKTLFSDLSIKEWHLTEWNSTPSHADLTNDSAYKAPFIIKNILENNVHIDSFGYWLLSDFHEEFRAPKQEFHGGLGLFTRNGIKKSGFFAFSFLKKLGSRILSQGERYIVTKSQTGYQILTYHYQHFHSIFLQEGQIAFDDPYQAFPEEKMAAIHLELQNLKAGSYRVTEHILSREYGSAMDIWLQNGAQKDLTERQIDELKLSTRPKVIQYTAKVTDTYIVQQALKPHEVRLIEMEFLV